MRVSEAPKFRGQNYPASGSTLTTVMLGVVVVSALYFGRELFVPIALAVLLSFVLAPLVSVLRRCCLPRSAAVIIVTALAFAALVGLGALVVAQVTELAGELPRYQTTLREKIQSLRGTTFRTNALDRASEVLQDLRKEIDQPNGGSPAARNQTLPSDRPIPVEVRQPDPSALQSLAMLIRPLISPVATMAIVFIFVVFILLQLVDLRNRLVRLAGAQDLQRTTAALEDAGQRLSRLFLTQLVLNAGFGLMIGFGLWIIGVPDAALWGVLAMIMRYVPYIGALIAAIFPLVLAAAVGPGWAMVLWTALLFVIVEAVVGHVIEPLVSGRSAGLSPVAVITAATFWTWMWGPIGLVLATPLTLCLVVLGRHVDRLEFLDVMFGDQPPLTPAELLYQRLLARDPVEATEQARTYLKEKPLIAYYDDILLKGLKLAQADAAKDLLDEERMARIRDGVSEIVEDLAAHDDNTNSPPPEDAVAEARSPLDVLDKVEASQETRVLAEQWRTEKAVLCLPGLGVLDEAAALMIVQLLERRGIGAHVEPAGGLLMSQMLNWDTKDVALVCLCYVENVTSAQVRYAVRRIRRRAPDVLVVVALLGNSSGIEGQELSAGTEFVQNSLHATLDKILDMAHRPPATAAPAAPPMTATAS